MAVCMFWLLSTLSPILPSAGPHAIEQVLSVTGIISDQLTATSIIYLLPVVSYGRSLVNTLVIFVKLQISR